LYDRFHSLADFFIKMYLCHAWISFPLPSVYSSKFPPHSPGVGSC